MSERPKRIQRKRTKGWRKPKGCICVGRPSKYSNPFRVMGKNEYLFSDASHSRHILSPWLIFDQRQDIRNNPATNAMAVEYFRRWVDGEFQNNPNVRPCPFTKEDIRRELGDHDLCCWCRLDDACHADVLLDISNNMMIRAETAAAIAARACPLEEEP